MEGGGDGEASSSSSNSGGGGDAGGDGLSIVVKQEQISFLNHFVRVNHPYESCAILLGKREKNEFVIGEIVPAQNRDSSSIRFTIENDKLFEIYKLADEKKSISHRNLPFSSLRCISFQHRQILYEFKSSSMDNKVNH